MTGPTIALLVTLAVAVSVVLVAVPLCSCRRMDEGSETATVGRPAAGIGAGPAARAGALEGAVRLDGLDGAIVGIGEIHTHPARLVYSCERILDLLVDDGMEPEEAMEFFDFNIACLWAGPGTPIILHPATWEEIAEEIGEEGG